MKKLLIHIILLAVLTSVSAQQLSIPRIDSMPNRPNPFLMRDWKRVALDYDAFIFDTARTGTYLPITRLSTSDGTNYPEVKTIRMDTYVGQPNHGNVAEAINVLPAVVSASLVGVDKTTSLNTNWVVKLKDFFNLKNGQQVYLNSYSTSTGDDWWYEIMPNVFFYQLYALYPKADADFPNQFVTIADRELSVVHQLGGTVQPWTTPFMNYRAFNLMTGQPNATSVPEPESAGSIAWLLVQAYTQTGQPKYRYGAELALDFLQNWTTNPSYEIQLPYGIAAAARLNAIEGTRYDLTKFLNWSFSTGQGTLRGWSCIVGNWNGYDVSGLIGEANDAGDDYAFSMNGFQHAAALLPVAKYDKRYARALAKWTLNLANASRLFYADGLPAANQEPASSTWASQYDTSACIPFESMKENWNDTRPCAMGDAVKGGWAATDLSMYSGSSVGYMAALIEKTNIEGILQLDLNKTDFRGSNTYPTYLYYNPLGTLQTVELVLPAGNHDVYDAISETTLQTNVSDTIRFTIDSDSVRLLVIYPTGKTTVVQGRFKTVDGAVIDFHANHDFSNHVRVKAFTASDTLVQKLDSITLYCLTESDVPSNCTFDWFQNDVLISNTTSGHLTWKAPLETGQYRLACRVSENGDTVRSSSLSVTVADKVYPVPVLSDIGFSGPLPFGLDSTVQVDPSLNTTDVEYTWTCDAGILSDENAALPFWRAPSSPGIYQISLTVTNPAGNSSFTKPVLVKDFSITDEPMPLIYYPMKGDAKNYARDAFHAVPVNAVATIGADGTTGAAFQFPSSTAYLYTPNETALNFQDQVAVSFWVKADALPSREQFILSHGSWEERYKVSVTPEKNLRWTVKTNHSVVDVDEDDQLQTSQYVHYTAQYTGYSLELYRNGFLQGFKALTGSINTTAKSVTIARKDEVTSDYSFQGSVDEVRIYPTELPQRIVRALPSTFSLLVDQDTMPTSFWVYPNPFSGELFFHLPQDVTIATAQVFDLTGRSVRSRLASTSSLQMDSPDGLFFLVLHTTSGETFRVKIIIKQ